MKRTAIVFALMLCVVLSACGIQPPEKTSDGAPWNSEWTTLGSSMGVEEMEGWVLERSEDVLAAEGMFYNVWTAGETITYTNEKGDEITAHDGEIYLVAAEGESPEKAAQMAEEWEALTEERYPDREVSVSEYAGQAFAISVYPNGASATGTRGSCAIRVDVAVQEGFEQDPAGILTEFLSHCHYAE